MLAVVQDLAIVRQRHGILTVTEHITGARVFLHAQAVHRMLVRKLNDLIAFHDIETDARDARIGLVVHENVAAIIGAVGEGDMRVMQVAIHVGAAVILEEFAGLGKQSLGQDLQAFVGLPPAGGAAAVEHGNTHQLAHRRQADDAQLAGLAAGEERIVFVELTRGDLGFQHRWPRGGSFLRRGLGLCIGRGNKTLAVGAESNSSGKTDTRGRRGRSKQSAPTDAFSFSGFVVAHNSLLGFQVADGVMASTGFSPIGLPPAVMMVFGPLPPLRIEGDDSASRFSRFSRTWIMCGQR